MIRTFTYVLVFTALAIVLSTRRIGARNWQYWAIQGLVILAVQIGRSL